MQIPSKSSSNPATTNTNATKLAHYPKDLMDRVPSLVSMALKNRIWGEQCFRYAIEYNRRTKKSITGFRKAHEAWKTAVWPEASILVELARLSVQQAKYVGDTSARKWLVQLLELAGVSDAKYPLLTVFDRQNGGQQPQHPASRKAPAKAVTKKEVSPFTHENMPEPRRTSVPVMHLQGITLTSKCPTREVWKVRMTGNTVMSVENHTLPVCVVDFSVGKMNYEELEPDPCGSKAWVKIRTFPVTNKPLEISPENMAFIGIYRNMVSFGLNIPPSVSLEVHNTLLSFFPPDLKTVENGSVSVRYYPLNLSDLGIKGRTDVVTSDHLVPYDLTGPMNRVV